MRITLNDLTLLNWIFTEVSTNGLVFFFKNLCRTVRSVWPFGIWKDKMVKCYQEVTLIRSFLSALSFLVYMALSFARISRDIRNVIKSSSHWAFRGSQIYESCNYFMTSVKSSQLLERIECKMNARRNAILNKKKLTDRSKCCATMKSVI